MFLPLNIGFDDLFCIVLFVVVLVRRNMLEKVPVRFGYAFWVITAFTIIGIVSVWNGSTYAPAYYRILYIKDIMKFGIYWCLFYSIIHSIDDAADMRKQLRYFTIALGVGALLVIMHYLHPRLMEPWTRVESLERTLEFRGRAYGAFSNANGAACMLAASICMMVVMMQSREAFFSRSFVIGLILVCLVAMALTKSRSGLMALTGTLILMCFLSRARKVAWVVVLAGIIVAGAFTQVRKEYLSRIGDIYTPAAGTFGPNVSGRFITWRSYFETATPRIYALGQGQQAGSFRNPSESHSAYVSLITVYGVGGAVWALIALVCFFRRGFYLVRSCGPPANLIGLALMWSLVAWGIYATAADAISSQYLRYLLFYLVVLISRAHNIARDEEAAFLYEEQYLEERPAIGSAKL